MENFEVLEQPEQRTAVVHEKVKMNELPRFFARALGDVYRTLHDQGLTPAGPPFALYFGMPGETVELEAGFPVYGPVKESKTVHTGTLPGGKCVHALHVGPFDTMAQTYGDLARYAQEHHLKQREKVWEVYLSDPQTQPDPKTWRTEIYWPVE